MYADYEYYSGVFGGKAISESNAAALENASDTVDILTYGRIRAAGFESLTEFQRSTVKRAVCKLAEWQTENADILSSPYKQYSINGVSAAVGASDTVKCVCGALIPSEIYALLKTTGLCYGGV